MKKQELLKIAKPILFNTEMVRAILDERKTVTRRIIKSLSGKIECHHNEEHEFILDNFAGREIPTGFVCRKCGLGVSPPHSRHGVGNSWIVPPYFSSDILYVRETFAQAGKYIFWYKADNNPLLKDILWKPSIHMPKEAARIFLRVTDVRVERLWDITEEQASAEGIRGYWAKPHNNELPFVATGIVSEVFRTRKEAFGKLWNSTVKKSDLDKYGWNANPWVWVIEFEKVNIE